MPSAANCWHQGITQTETLLQEGAVLWLDIASL